MLDLSHANKKKEFYGTQTSDTSDILEDELEKKIYHHIKTKVIDSCYRPTLHMKYLPYKSAPHCPVHTIETSVLVVISLRTEQITSSVVIVHDTIP